MNEKIELFDSTLRDGAQGGSVNFSAGDKLGIMKALDAFGIDYIEAGNPASNQKDEEFFHQAEGYPFKHAKLVAFGATRRKQCRCEEDHNTLTLAQSPVDIITIFGKSWDMHVTEILHTTLEENLAMIADTIQYLKRHGKSVFYDAEHFYDGMKHNRSYALETILTAAKAGAARIVLADTNGGCFPKEISELTQIAYQACKTYNIPLGIHCHNDTGCAIANSIAAIQAGVTHVQGTFTGIGERCGNANLAVLIGNLQEKLGYDCVSMESMGQLTNTAVYISEVANLALSDNMPYVGRNAFAHKGGMHVDGVSKNPASFEHISPESVGNARRFLLSEVAGRSVILSRLQKVEPALTRDSPQTRELIDLLKEREYQGFQYEAAEASFELLVRKHLGLLPSYFDIIFFKIIGEMFNGQQDPSTAMIKVNVGDKYQLTASEGDGPVHALDRAMKQALKIFYPQLEKTRLTDYKVRVMNGDAGTAAIVRVLINTTDGESEWTTVGASGDIINASMKALTDSINYKLLKSGEKRICL